MNNNDTNNNNDVNELINPSFINEEVPTEVLNAPVEAQTEVIEQPAVSPEVTTQAQGNSYKPYQANSNSPISKMLDEEEVTLADELAAEYMGNNFEKYYRSFNIAAFFFGILYYFYKKMLARGLIIYIVFVTCNVFLRSIINKGFITILLLVIFEIIVGKRANNAYTNKVDSSVRKIMADHPNESSENLKEICRKSGKGSFGFVIIGIIGVITLAFIGGTIRGLIEGKETPIPIPDSVTKIKKEDSIKKYIGTEYYNGKELIKDNEIILNDELEYIIPENYEIESIFDNDYSLTIHYLKYTYAYCGVKLYSIANFDNVNLLYDFENNKKHFDNEISFISNNIKWRRGNYSSADNKQDFFLYYAKINNKVYLARVTSTKKFNDVCTKNGEDFVKSIKAK